MVALAALAFVACHREFEIPTTTGFPEFEGDGIVLKLDVGEMGLSTRVDAGTRPGDDDGAFNENILGAAVDIFFFPENASDESESTLSVRASVTMNGTDGFVSIPVTVSKISTIFGGTTPGDKCVVYVVANYNGTTAFDHENGSYTLGSLKAMPLAVADWSTFPQESFVMTGMADLTLVDAAASTPATGEIEMRRVAAKVTFKLTVADTIVVVNTTTDQDGNVTMKELDKWTPKRDAMTVYLQYGMNYSLLDGEPQSVPANPKSQGAQDSLYTYQPHKLVDSGNKVTRNRTFIDGIVHHDPPTEDQEEWEVIQRQGTAEVPLYDTKTSDLSTDGPFYSYPVTWDPGVQTEPFLKLVIPWNNGSRTKYYYYKIPFSVTELESNNWYEITLDVQILGGEDEQPIPLEATYKVVDWVPGTTSAAGVVAARYLSVPTKLFTMYNIEELKIPMLSSHECEIVNIEVTKPNIRTGETITGSVDELSVSSLEEIYLKHELNNTMGSSLDCTPYTITFRVRQKDNHDYYADVKVIQYPAIYVESKAGGQSFVDGYYLYITGNKPENNASGNSTRYYHTYSGGSYNTPYGNMSSSKPSSQTNMTAIHVTAFTDSYYQYEVANTGVKKDYIIGDPRIPFNESTKISKSLIDYLTPAGSNNNTTAWTTDQLSKLKISTEEDQYIAPSFMLASEWGRQGSGDSSFETVTKRCATYQEAGYPAGRWRVPTEAEVMFCINMQVYGFIGDLFKANATYWISNGKSISRNNAYDVTVSDGGGQSVRCVYDIWYWGEEPATTSPDYQYAVMP